MILYALKEIEKNLVESNRIDLNRGENDGRIS
jgi:hypothetical protein